MKIIATANVQYGIELIDAEFGALVGMEVGIVGVEGVAAQTVATAGTFGIF